MQLLSSRRARALMVLCVATGSLLVSASAASAASKVVTMSCPDSAFINPDGSTGDVILPGAPPFDLPTDVPTFSSTAVAPGSSFTAQAPSATISVPSHLDPLPGISVDVNEAKNIMLWIKVSGAASIGDPTLSGGNVTNATATKVAADTIKVVFPGNKTGSTVPAGDLFFTGGSSFTSPAISLPVTANNAAGDISFNVSDFQTDSAVVINVPPALGARAHCSPTGDTQIGSVTVKDPRAPLAVDDAASTPKNTPVTIDVLKNDQNNQQGDPPDPSTLEITKAAGHGTAEVKDGKVLYTPANGFQGDDTLTYQVCAAVEVPAKAIAASQQFCDSASVTVTVGSVGRQGGGSGSSSSTTTTTVAKELPRTGSSSAPLALAGFGLAGMGAGLAITQRKRRSA